ncbi:uncharacterized protein [Rutidosis leptorrhynchoides]|uniref:uncharacterized protein isoform X1 n=1 Tax=Rutidosis leptorrhynchoides TaxID=125765 RepID=UPI003A9961D2
MNTEEDDRLSSLSDDLIVKILSHIDTKHVVRTSILSPRWKNTWKSITHLDLCSDDVTSLTSFNEFTRVLSSRNNEIDLFSLKLSVRGGYRPEFVKIVVNYAFSHNVQKMTFIWLDEMPITIPNSLLMSQSLKDLTLIGCASIYNQSRIESSLYLPSLTTLHLENLIIKNENPGGLFSKCLNLKNLTLSNCDINDPYPFNDGFFNPLNSINEIEVSLVNDHNPFISHSESSNLSNRNNEIELSSVKLSVGRYKQAFVKTVVDYAFSHNVQKMTIIWVDGWDIEIPNSFFTSQSLKDLTLIGSSRYNSKIKSSLDLPALTTLHLENFTLSNKNPDECGGVFFKCLNLKNLTLVECSIDDPKHLVCHSEFSKLTPETGLFSSANVVVPHLKNLIVYDCRGYIEIYAPELSSLMYEVSCYENFYANSLSCLEKVDFFMCPLEDDGHYVVEILQQFHNVKYLTLGLEILEVASFVDAVSNVPSPFGKLTSLKIYPRRLERKKNVQKVKIPKQVRNFLLGASPNATVSIYSRKEMKAFKDATSARRMMAKLQV